MKKRVQVDAIDEAAADPEVTADILGTTGVGSTGELR